MGNDDVEVVRLRDDTDPETFADFIRHIAARTEHRKTAIRILHGTDLGRAYLKLARRARPSLNLRPRKINLEEVASSVEAATILDQLISDRWNGRPSALYIRQRFLNWEPGNLALYPIMIEIAKRREQNRKITSLKIDNIAAVRRAIERELELEQYVALRLNLSAANPKPRTVPLFPKDPQVPPADNRPEMPLSTRLAL